MKQRSRHIRKPDGTDVLRCRLSTMPGWFGYVGIDLIENGGTLVEAGLYLDSISPKVIDSSMIQHFFGEEEA